MHLSNKSRYRTNRGFTLAEVLVVVVIIGILALMFLPETTRTKGMAELNLVKSKASSLNMAQASYIGAYGLDTALTQWAGKTNDQRYALLKPFIGYPPPTLADYTVAGYAITFPDNPHQPVAVADPGGTAVVYQ